MVDGFTFRVKNTFLDVEETVLLEWRSACLSRAVSTPTLRGTEGSPKSHNLQRCALKPQQGDLEDDKATMDGTADGGSSDDAPSVSTTIPASPRLASRGARLHRAGQCKPCAWFWKPSSCVNKQDCEFCHACPPEALRERMMQRKHLRQRQRYAGAV